MATKIHNPNTVKHGAVQMENAVSVSVSENMAAALVGDEAHVYPTACVDGMVSESINVGCNDLGAAIASGAYTSLSAIFAVVDGSTAKMVCTRAKAIGNTKNAAYGGVAGNATYMFYGVSSDGTTNPISWTGA